MAARDDEGTRRLAKVALVAIAVLLVGGGLWLLTAVRSGNRREAISHAVDERIAELGALPRDRPPLRGVLREGNAYDAQLAAVALLPAVPSGTSSSLKNALEHGTVPADLATLAAANAPALQSLRETTHLREAGFPLDPRRSSESTPIAAHLRAMRLVLVAAFAAPTGECLEGVVDAMRVAQDFATGVGLIGKAVEAAFSYEFALAIVRCAARASPEQLARASDEVATLRHGSPPLGPGVEMQLIGMVADLSAFADDGEENVLESWWRQGERYAACEAWLEASSSWRGLDMELDAGAVLAKAQAHDDEVLRADHTKIAALMVRPFVTREGERVALLRMVHLALRGYEDGLASAAKAADLLDPWGKAPLLHRPLADGSVLVWSVGPDASDDRGAAGSDDITLKLPVRSPR